MIQKRPLHPILAQADEIAERGLVVFDDIRSMPLYDEPYTTDLMTISINLSGWVKAECDMRPVVFQPHDLAVVTPHHILCAQESSADYHAMIIVDDDGVIALTIAVVPLAAQHLQPATQPFHILNMYVRGDVAILRLHTGFAELSQQKMLGESCLIVDFYLFLHISRF